MCYEWICIIIGVGLSLVVGFIIGLSYAKHLMKAIIRDNVAMHKQINECKFHMDWIREVDKYKKGEYNRRLIDKILES